MPFCVKEIITNDNAVIRETVSNFTNKNEMAQWIAARKVSFNEERLAATINGQGVSFAQRKQFFSITET